MGFSAVTDYQASSSSAAQADGQDVQMWESGSEAGLRVTWSVERERARQSAMTFAMGGDTTAGMGLQPGTGTTAVQGAPVHGSANRGRKLWQRLTRWRRGGGGTSSGGNAVLHAAVHSGLGTKVSALLMTDVLLAGEVVQGQMRKQRWPLALTARKVVREGWGFDMSVSFHRLEKGSSEVRVHATVDEGASELVVKGAKRYLRRLPKLYLDAAVCLARS